ncbi:MAG: CHAT domain-containing protein, partial [Acidobacteria bacterium]|nr:CHAT domain-containing protein [Acidobacteriota bacterium]
ENPASDPSALTEIASTLYEGLLGAVDKDIERSERLIISTDGNLEHIPFGALLRVRGADARFLGTWKPMSHVVSLSVRRELRLRPAAPRDGGIAVFADPRHPSFDELPDAVAEARRIAAAWGPGARLYSGRALTRGNLFHEFETARVLHIATHAVSNGALALGTGLVVTPEGAGDDGVLRAWELIHRSPLRADLVVLSGCETGPGSQWFAMGEGSFDLSRHFLEAGAGTVLSASWRISDDVTADFMTRFHDGLLRGLSADRALEAAQSEMSSTPRWAHPFHWAAFRLVGLGDDAILADVATARLP